GESRTIGRLRIPEALLLRMRAAPCVQVQMPLAARVAFLLEDYAHFVQDVDSFCERLAALREVRGASVVERWQAEARAGHVAVVVEELLTHHYDPIYERSMQRNFTGFATAQMLDLPDAAPAALAAAAAALAATERRP
ncbi:MAG: tRNA 2-selenouridine(34) synthase MnmH, partial [Rubrivivax sp.]|nr:tRNA 2-selenouridine(34) synthase MnmH [Rubrivivax sp.]